MIRLYHRIKKIPKKHSILLLFLVLPIILLVKYYSYYDAWMSFTILVPDSIVDGQSQNAWYEQQLAYGDEVKGETGKTTAILTDLKTIAINNDRFLLLSYNGLASVSRVTHKATFQNQPLSLNSTLSLLTGFTPVTGKVVAVANEFVESTHKIRVFVRYVNVRDWEIDQISIGDRITSLNGEALVKILGIAIADSTSQFSFIVDNRRMENYYYSSYRDNMKDIVLELEVSATQSNGVWYLMNRYPLRINERISLQFPHIVLNNLVIQHVEEETAK